MNQIEWRGNKVEFNESKKVIQIKGNESDQNDKKEQNEELETKNTLGLINPEIKRINNKSGNSKNHNRKNAHRKKMGL